MARAPRPPSPPVPGASALPTGSNAPQDRQRSLEQAIGTQIRTLRRKLDMTGAELAHRAQLSTGMLSKIENGLISPSLATLQALAGALNVPLASFFAGFDEAKDCSYVKAGQGVAIERRGTKVGHHYQLLGHALGGSIAVEPYLITLSEEAVPYTGFQHAGIELIHMLTGSVVYRHGDKTYRLDPGDTLFFDATAVHGPEDLVTKPMTYLSIIIYPRE